MDFSSFEEEEKRVGSQANIAWEDDFSYLRYAYSIFIVRPSL